MSKQRIHEHMERMREELQAMALDIWAHPEAGFREVHASRIQKEFLERLGARIKSPIDMLDTAFVAEYGEGKPIIGILGEFDALPELSQKAGVNYKEPLKEGARGHGCGHNLLGTGGVAAFAACMQTMKEDHLPGTIRYYGCPAEESLSGKSFMARAGVFDDLDCCLSWHPSGEDGVGYSNNTAQTTMEFHFHGIEAHAAANPHLGRSALDAVELMNVGCNYLREHIIPTARVHYMITDGGKAVNIVPGEASSLYAIRAPQVDQMQDITERLIDIAKGAALMTGTTMDYVMIGIYHNRLPNAALADLAFENYQQAASAPWTDEELAFADSMKDAYPEGTVERVVKGYGIPMEQVKHNLLPHPVKMGNKEKVAGGSSDVGDVSWITPTLNMTGTCCPVMVNGHTWQGASCYGTTFAAKGMIRSGEVLAMTAYDLLTDHKDVIDAARQEWEHDKGGRSYTAIPADMKPYFDKE